MTAAGLAYIIKQGVSPFESVMNMEAVLLEGVCKSFGEVRAVNGLDVRVPGSTILFAA